MSTVTNFFEIPASIFTDLRFETRFDEEDRAAAILRLVDLLPQEFLRGNRFLEELEKEREYRKVPFFDMREAIADVAAFVLTFNGLLTEGEVACFKEIHVRQLALFFNAIARNMDKYTNLADDVELRQAKIEKLKAQLSEADDRFLKKEQEVWVLSMDNADLNAEKERLERELEQVQEDAFDEVSWYQTVVNDMNIDYLALEDRMKRLEMELTEENMSSNLYESLAHGLNKNCDVFLEQIEDLKFEVYRLQKQLKEEDTMTSLVVDLSVQTDENVCGMKEMEEEIQDLRQQIEELFKVMESSI
ncbi:hypothetical protein L596_029029 [Steinernema carpocapsae]|uniref:Uncharacterized protein n=1 Tax=Steinernema carpocapsae TaxID=34508 RepID=A0A4U5LTE6_STECR|nr:hypothetical protein L596_029029 [Steinernema carpocapsae]